MPDAKATRPHRSVTAGWPRATTVSGKKVGPSEAGKSTQRTKPTEAASSKNDSVTPNQTGDESSKPKPGQPDIVQKMNEPNVERVESESKGQDRQLKRQRESTSSTDTSSGALKTISSASTARTTPDELIEGRQSHSANMNEGAQVRGISPRGLFNFSNACFANASIQCLSGVPELVEYCKTQTGGILTEVEAALDQETKVDRKGIASKDVRKLRKKVKAIFEEYKELM